MKTDSITVARRWAAFSLLVGIFGTAIAASVIDSQTPPDCVPDTYLGTTCPPFIHNYFVAYLISGVAGTIFTFAALFLIIERAVETGIRESRSTSHSIARMASSE